MSDAERAALGAAQERLLAALVGGAEPPPGFDPERIRIQAQALLA
ncbi:endonuclease, partial [Streptomyces bryophytorum]|nr:endonuclease [Actinacidiphila bryophytorum]